SSFGQRIRVCFYILDQELSSTKKRSDAFWHNDCAKRDKQKNLEDARRTASKSSDSNTRLCPIDGYEVGDQRKGRSLSSWIRVNFNAKDSVAICICASSTAYSPQAASQS